MNILYVNDNDLAGRRFNGHDLQLMLNQQKGFKAKHFVVNKASNSEYTIPLITTEGEQFMRDKCIEFEDKISMQSVIYPWGELIGHSKEFEEADIVHYHLLFNHYMSLFSFRRLAQLKPTVWTLHDPWALTGHCVHPLDCTGWLTGCKNCNHLDRYAPLREDHTASIWNIKKDIYQNIDIDIVVASQWMYEMVKKSPLTKHFGRVHLIPFGIDLNLFKRKSNREEIRKKIGISKENFVMMFRQSEIEWKGILYIKKMLSDIKMTRPVTLLTVGEKGLLNEYKKKFQIIEYGWVNDNDLMVDLYSVSDLFLMPSIAESFGLMAVEALACSLPIIVFNGTALPGVTFTPKCGISLEKGDNEDFVKTVNRLILSPKECFIRGQEGRKVALKNYDVTKHNKKMIELYNSIYDRKKQIKF